MTRTIASMLVRHCWWSDTTDTGCASAHCEPRKQISNAPVQMHDLFGITHNKAADLNFFEAFFRLLQVLQGEGCLVVQLS